MINEALGRLGAGIGFERSDFFGRRRQADQVDVEATNEHAPRSGRRSREAFLFAFRFEEAVDVERRRWRGERLQRPPVAACASRRRFGERIERGIGKCGAESDPFFQRLGFFFRKRFFRGHVAGGDALPKEAFFGIAGSDDGAAVSAARESLFLREVESSFELLGVMAFDAVSEEHRSCRAFKVFESCAACNVFLSHDEARKKKHAESEKSVRDARRMRHRRDA